MNDKQKPQTPPVNLQIGVDPMRTPVLYADAIIITSNENGLILDIAQRLGSTGQASIVSRVGLSKDHAKKLAEKLVEHIALREGRAVTGNIKVNN